MKDLIEALQILSKYMPEDNKFPTHCEHDILHVCDVDVDRVTDEDMERLEKLVFVIGEFDNSFSSTRFGSC